ncbi:hypothetical protein KDD17_18410 [Sulfitobacter albidus]|uniref:Uncharacterized protein n=1 Tax=Sulfitobacter albidus TaxID=2829501 RepID=A0A975PPD4_9RHOB|nr:hypothetical protein [Sulfitobacter albidus]QUJ78411.1 hypothetical protein KDD17_18410 [Sulfitobacter albidus]
MIKYIHPDGRHCYRALHTVEAIYTDDAGKLVSRARTADGSGTYTFEIREFEVLTPGVLYD